MERLETTVHDSATGQQGNVLITVMLTMMLVSALVSALIEHFLVTEARAVEESLAKVRVYWAMSGHVDYIYSRIIQYDAVPAACTPSLNAALGSFSFFATPAPAACSVACLGSASTSEMEEMLRCFMYDLTSPSTDTKTWSNYDGNANYTFDIQHVPPNVPADAGEMQFKLTNPGAVSVLNGLEQRLPPLHVRSTLGGAPVLAITQYERF